MPEMRDALSMGVQETSLKKYIAIGIVACYVISFTLNTIIDSFIKGNHYTVTTTASLITASFVAGYFFFKDHKRASSIAENARYSLHFMLWGVWVPLVLLVGILLAFFYVQGDDILSFPVVVFADFLQTETREALLVVALVCLVFAALMALNYVVVR